VWFSHLRLRNKIGYGLGDMGVSISYFAVGFYFMYFLTDIVMMDPFLAGLAIFIGKLWDGMNDPIMGIISDRTRSRFGKKRVYILFGAIPFGISFILLWLIPQSIGQWYQFALAVLALLVYATTYSICVVPYMSLVPIMSEDYDERTQITGIRAILSTIGTIFGGTVALFISNFQNEVLGLRLMAISFGVFTAISLIVAALSTKGVEDLIESKSLGIFSEITEEYVEDELGKVETDKKEKQQDHRIADYSIKQYIVILKEKNVLILLGMKFFGAIGTGCLTAALPYFAEHILGDESISTIGLAIYIAVSALMIPLWNLFSKKFDKRRLLLIGIILVAIVLIPTGFVIGEGSTILFYVCCGLLGISMSSYLLIPYSLVPDLVNFYEHKTGERHESIFFGLWMTFHQIGLAVAGLILGGILKAFSYDAELPVQPDSAKLGIRFSFGLLPSVFLIIAIVILQFYGISKSVFQQLNPKANLEEVQSQQEV